MTMIIIKTIILKYKPRYTQQGERADGRENMTL
jgi:hypothetical protein